MKELLIFLLLFLFIESKTICLSFRCKRGFDISPCPKGFIYFNGRCRKETEICPGGQFNGYKCICPARTKLINGKCEKKNREI